MHDSGRARAGKAEANAPERRWRSGQLVEIEAVAQALLPAQPAELDESARGRPGRRIGPALVGNRPASDSARRSRNSICAFVLRRSSDAHLASAS
jgi:hypothetical protein